ncbi:MAG TPA: mechanosensitive ion channel family protein [Egibacteraceae bacterium]|nr:mechanosensitive ion channel family protein [Egibacteraceae bacterium]
MLQILRALFSFAAVDDSGAREVCVDNYDGISGVCEAVYRLTGGAASIAQFAGAAIPALLKIVLIIALAVVAAYLTRRVIRRFVATLTEEGLTSLGPLRKRGDPEAADVPDVGRAAMRARTIASVLRSITTAIIWTFAILMMLGVIGIPLGPLIAGAGVGGIALGFGAQTLVRDFLAGIFILLEDQYGIGDIVDVGEANGVIEGVTLRTTRLRDVQGTVWYVPNGEIRRVGNKSQQWARALLDIGVAYDTDLAHATSVIKRVADEVWQDPEWSEAVLEEPEVWGLEDFAADQLTLRLVVKTVPSKQFKVNREIRRRLKSAFDAEGIEIPFPQRTVWVRGDNHLKPAAEPTADEASQAPSDAS